MISLPSFVDSSNIGIPESLQNQAFFDEYRDDLVYYRVTEKQFKELTNDFYISRTLAEGKINQVRFTYEELFALFYHIR